ncbi:adenosylmethionine-8-amino-7-oxononanoate aminotransferase [Microbacterium resistens]|uniref:Adenosylmethionine-8-amino-7-oxononanoate aminotransferase n=1 Tax=Microbacterium resistens TaxID=156977 RepID=A0ABU1SBI0_9MICO|nr:daptide-type RiPP biosynthesis aminotransferase [Microbacterium resistens]MDR6866967.1 adenosylmethionine-8-amino-7-oxononanoate aminotransferase [Microbacterium resistens]
MERAWTALVRPSADPGPAAWAVSAKGTRIRFADGVDAFCATSGLWNVPLGYGNAEVAEAVGRALRDASYLTLFRRSHPYAEEAAARLIAFTGMPFSRVLFSTSGGAANDAVMKLVRQFWHLAGSPQRRIVVGLRGSYHGLTHGAHGLSGDELGQAVYGIDRRDVRHVPVDDGAGLETLMRREGNRVAAVIVEPVLGTGAVEVPPSFLAVLDRLRAEHGFLLVADEVATGFGRTGQRFASAGWASPPDAMILSKALTNGTCAASAIVVGERIVSAFDREDALFVHGETQAGTPASCAAILATLDLYDSLDADALFRDVADRLDAVVARLLHHPRIVAAQGRGAFRALRILGTSAGGREREGAQGGETEQGGGAGPGEGLAPDAVTDLVERIRRRGVVVHPGPAGIQLIPAAIAAAADLDRAAAAIETALDEQDAAIDERGAA